MKKLYNNPAILHPGIKWFMLLGQSAQDLKDKEYKPTKQKGQIIKRIMSEYKRFIVLLTECNDEETIESIFRKMHQKKYYAIKRHIKDESHYFNIMNAIAGKCYMRNLDSNAKQTIDYYYKFLGK